MDNTKTSNAFWYYFLCNCLAGGHAYTFLVGFIRNGGENYKVKLYFIGLVALIVIGTLTYIYYKASKENKAGLNIVVAFVWGIAIAVGVNVLIEIVDNKYSQQGALSFLGAVFAMVLFMFFDSADAKKKRAGFVFLGIHFGISWVMLFTALSKLGYSVPDLDFLGDLKKAIIFTILALATIIGEVLLIANPNLTIGEDLQAWGIFLGMTCLAAGFSATAIPTDLQFIFFSAALFATAIWAMFAYKAYVK